MTIRAMAVVTAVALSAGTVFARGPGGGGGGGGMRMGGGGGGMRMGMQRGGGGMMGQQMGGGGGGIMGGGCGGRGGSTGSSMGGGMSSGGMGMGMANQSAGLQMMQQQMMMQRLMVARQAQLNTINQQRSEARAKRIETLKNNIARNREKKQELEASRKLAKLASKKVDDATEQAKMRLSAL